jgi:N-acetylated-alpha-linked acidic dipeptidase
LLDAAQKERARGRRREFSLGALGAGSDYVAFLDHAGIASLNLGFSGAGQGGVYHSAYDTLAWFERFSDGDLRFGKALTQVMVTSLLRLADAPLLPFEFGSLSRTVRGYVEEIQKEARAHSGTVDLSGLLAQVDRLAISAKAYDEAAAAPAQSQPIKANEILQRAEQSLLLPDGLPRREWYRHQLYAPGLYTGYAVKTLPGVREAVEAQRWEEASQQARRATQALRAMTAQVQEAARLLKQAAE